jgi:hypothetical protein
MLHRVSKFAEHRSLVLVFLLSLLSAFACHGQVVLNEVCAENGGAAVTPGGTSPDYVELYNTGSSSVSLSGWSLTDDPTKPFKFQFPATATIASKGRLVVWLDSETSYPGVICTNFSLKASGEEVELHEGANLRDSLAFGQQVTGVSLSRVPDGSGPWQLGLTTPGSPNAVIAPAALGTPAALRLNEWLAANSAGPTFDWLEIYNPKTNGIVSLAGLTISDQTSSVSTPGIGNYSYLNSGAFLRFWCDDTTGGNHLPFKLSSTSGEILTIYQPDKTTIIDRITFGPQTIDISMGRLPDGGTNIVYFPSAYVTPGAANAYQPITNVVVNEVLAHTDPPLEDAVELYNLTGSTVDLGNWWLSNSEDVPQKFRIPAGTSIPPFGYAVFYEHNQLSASSTTAGFNRSGTGTDPDFTFNSAHGDTVVLCEGLPNGGLTGRRLTKNFDASANGVSFGRYVKSDGGTDLVAASKRTFGSDFPTTVTQFRTGTGAPNSYPLVGPLIISEIFYEPSPVIVNGLTNDNALDEFIELTSIATVTLNLFDPIYPTNTWRLTGGVSFDFPRYTTVPPGGSLLVVNFDPAKDLVQLAAFRTKYGVPETVPLFGPFSGKLNNFSDSVRLEKPDPVQLPPHPDAGFVPFILVEKVNYEATNGWPANASGTGFSIQRLNPQGYANDQTNWFGALPTPGQIGTPPPTPVTILEPKLSASGFSLSFGSVASVSYTVEVATSLTLRDWIAFTNVVGNGAVITVQDKAVTGDRRYYRVRSP